MLCYQRARSAHLARSTGQGGSPRRSRGGSACKAYRADPCVPAPAGQYDGEGCRGPRSAGRHDTGGSSKVEVADIPTDMHRQQAWMCMSGKDTEG
eukprot:45093-Pelagomonas_calceolata.AAC.5